MFLSANVKTHPKANIEIDAVVKNHYQFKMFPTR